MRIEFDPEKRNRTLQHRGIDFADAQFVFDGTESTLEDLREDYGETRNTTIGKLNGRFVVVVWTPRQRNGENVVRIISMRNANAREIKEVSEQLR